jgi:hypothetical protein
MILIKNHAYSHAFLTKNVPHLCHRNMNTQLSYAEAKKATHEAQMQMTHHIEQNTIFPKVLSHLIASYIVIPKSYSFKLHFCNYIIHKMYCFNHPLCGEICLISAHNFGVIYVHTASSNWSSVRTLQCRRSNSNFRGMTVWKTKLLIADMSANGIECIDIRDREINNWSFELFFDSDGFSAPYDIDVIGDKCLVVDHGNQRVACYNLSLNQDRSCVFTLSYHVEIDARLWNICVDSMTNITFIFTQNIHQNCQSIQSINLETKEVSVQFKNDSLEKEAIVLALTYSDGILYMGKTNGLFAVDILTKKVIKQIEIQFSSSLDFAGISVMNRFLFVCSGVSVFVIHLDEFFSTTFNKKLSNA